VQRRGCDAGAPADFEDDCPPTKTTRQDCYTAVLTSSDKDTGSSIARTWPSCYGVGAMLNYRRSLVGATRLHIALAASSYDCGIASL